VDGAVRLGAGSAFGFGAALRFGFAFAFAFLAAGFFAALFFADDFFFFPRVTARFDFFALVLDFFARFFAMMIALRSFRLN
jgi:hypothetical protein